MIKPSEKDSFFKLKKPLSGRSVEMDRKSYGVIDRGSSLEKTIENAIDLIEGAIEMTFTTLRVEISQQGGLILWSLSHEDDLSRSCLELVEKGDGNVEVVCVGETRRTTTLDGYSSLKWKLEPRVFRPSVTVWA